MEGVGVKPTILLTGATGFLGSALVREFVTDFDVIALIRETSSLERIMLYRDMVRFVTQAEGALQRVFTTGRVDTIVHAAVHYGHGDTDHESVWDANVTLPLQLFRMGQRHDVTTFVNIDTFFSRLPESYPYLKHYRRSKQVLRELLEQEQQELALSHLFLEHLYGPGDRPEKFLPSMIRRIVGGETEIALTRGEQERDFVHVDDVARAVRAVIEHGNHGAGSVHSYDIGTGSPVSIRELLEFIVTVSGSTSKLRFGALPYREGEMMTSGGDLSEISALGWRPQVHLWDGIRQLVQAVG